MPAADVQHRPFIVVLCTFSDDTTIPAAGEDAVKRFLTLQGLGTGNVVDYFNDVTYGRVSLAGDKVVGWYPAPFATTSATSTPPPLLSRAERVSECANAVPASAVDFSQYYGVIMVTNVASDGGSCYSGQGMLTIHKQPYKLACIAAAYVGPQDVGAMAHEIGHALAFPHSYSEALLQSCPSPAPGTGVYGDPWDLMSTECTFYFSSQSDTLPGAFIGDGPGLNVPNLLAQGWLPGSIPIYHAGDATTVVKLAALSHPTAGGVLTVKIIPDPSNPNDFYTLEYRQKDGWDAGIPENTVLIHEVKSLPSLNPSVNNPSPFSYLISSNQSVPCIFVALACEWLPGQTWDDSSGKIEVRIISIDPNAGTATISIGYPSLFPQAPLVKILAPGNNSDVFTGVPFDLVASATTFDGRPLPDSAIVWTANGAPIGNGHTLTTTRWDTGKYTVTVTATDPSNSLTATGSIILDSINPPQPSATSTAGAAPSGSGSAVPSESPTAAPAPPSVQIVSPTNGSSYVVYNTNGSFSLTISSQASGGVTAYAWSDSLALFTDSKASDTLTITPSTSKIACNTMVNDVIHITVTASDGQMGSATPVTISIDRQCNN
jgi:M6 family metalloprotease-like protein